MNGLTPQTREEAILNTLLSAAGGETVNDLTAETRREQWYQNILDAIKGDNLTYTLNAEMRREEWLEDFIEAAQAGGGGGAWDKEPPDDGKTRLYIDLISGSLSPVLTLKLNGSAVVDWGDGSDTDTLTGENAAVTKSHTYEKAGKYIITMSVTGSASIFGSSSYSKILSDSTSYGNSGKAYLYTLKKAILRSGFTLSDYAFNGCASLERVDLPTSITEIPKNAFNACRNLKAIYVPEGVTALANYAIQNCETLSVCDLPSTLQSIGNYGIYQAYCLKELHFRSATPPTVGSSCFTSLYTGCKIYVPTGKLSAYTSASGYPSSSTYTYVEE